MGLGRRLGCRAQQGCPGNGGVDVGLVAGAGRVRLQVLLLSRGSLMAIALQLVLGCKQLVMEDWCELLALLRLGEVLPRDGGRLGGRRGRRARNPLKP